MGSALGCCVLPLLMVGRFDSLSNPSTFLNILFCTNMRKWSKNERKIVTICEAEGRANASLSCPWQMSHMRGEPINSPIYNSPTTSELQHAPHACIFKFACSVQARCLHDCMQACTRACSACCSFEAVGEL